MMHIREHGLLEAARIELKFALALLGIVACLAALFWVGFALLAIALGAWAWLKDPKGTYRRLYGPRPASTRVILGKEYVIPATTGQPYVAKLYDWVISIGLNF